MSLLGRPTYVHSDHLAPLPCCGMLGLECSELDVQRAIAKGHRSCVVCHGESDRIVRECGKRGCHRYKVHSYDDFRLPTRAA